VTEKFRSQENGLLRVGSQTALPNRNHFPIAMDQLGDRQSISRAIAIKLLLPEFFARCGHAEKGACHMSVPKAAIHEDCRVPFR
jgi:hypothetical protein